MLRIEERHPLPMALVLEVTIDFLLKRLKWLTLITGGDDYHNSDVELLRNLIFINKKINGMIETWHSREFPMVDWPEMSVVLDTIYDFQHSEACMGGDYSTHSISLDRVDHTLSYTNNATVYSCGRQARYSDPRTHKITLEEAITTDAEGCNATEVLCALRILYVSPYLVDELYDKCCQGETFCCDECIVSTMGEIDVECTSRHYDGQFQLGYEYDDPNRFLFDRDGNKYERTIDLFTYGCYPLKRTG